MGIVAGCEASHVGCAKFGAGFDGEDAMPGREGWLFGCTACMALVRIVAMSAPGVDAIVGIEGAEGIEGDEEPG